MRLHCPGCPLTCSVLCRLPPDGEAVDPRTANRFRELDQDVGASDGHAEIEGPEWTLAAVDRIRAARAERNRAASIERQQRAEAISRLMPTYAQAAQPRQRAMRSDEVAARTTRALPKADRAPTAERHRSKATIQRAERRARSESRPAQKLRFADTAVVYDLRGLGPPKAAPQRQEAGVWAAPERRAFDTHVETQAYPPLPARDGPEEVQAPRQVPTGQKIPPVPQMTRTHSAPTTPEGGSRALDPDELELALIQMAQLFLERRRGAE